MSYFNVMNSKFFRTIFFAVLTVLLVFTPLARGTTTTRLWAITPVFLIIYMLVFVWLWGINNRSNMVKRNVKIAVLDKMIIAFVTITLISFVFSVYKYDSFYAFLRLLGYVGLYYLVVNNYTRGLMLYILRLVICIGTGISIYGLLQYFGIFSHDWWHPKIFLSATYVNHNHLAGYLELIIPVTIGMIVNAMKKVYSKGAFGSKHMVEVVLLTISLVITMFAFIFAQSRGGWISLGIALFVMNIILIKRKAIKTYSLGILVLIIFGIFSYFYFSEGLVSKRIGSMIDVNQGEASMESRIDIWQGTSKMIRNAPWIGVGIGCFEWGVTRYRPEVLGMAGIRPRYAHNEYLQIASETGYFGLIFMLFILSVVISRGLGYKNKKNLYSKSDQINYEILGCGAGMLSLAIHGLVDFNFHIVANMMLFIVLAGIIMGHGSFEE